MLNLQNYIETSFWWFYSWNPTSCISCRFHGASSPSADFLPRHSPEKQTIRLQLSLSKSLQLHRGPAHILFVCILSLPLLHGGPVKHVPHACCLLLEELGVLSALLSPGRVERRGVLVHQVGVLCASRPTKVFHLCRKHKPEKIREPRDWREKETLFFYCLNKMHCYCLYCSVQHKRFSQLSAHVRRSQWKQQQVKDDCLVIKASKQVLIYENAQINRCRLTINICRCTK